MAITITKPQTTQQRYPFTMRYDLALLPANAKVTGRATKDGGYDGRNEKNVDKEIATFSGDSPEEIMQVLSGLDFDKIEVTKIDFS